MEEVGGMRSAGIVDELRHILCNLDTVIVCIGSPLRMDDQAGLMVCDKLRSRGLSVIKCEYGLENCMLEVSELKTKNMLLVDAVYSEDLGPGDIVLVEEKDIIDKNISPITTHNIPFKTMISILRNTIGLEKIYLLGIRVKNIDIGLDVSREVSIAVDKVVDLILDIVESCRES